ncbi:regulatory protein MarR [Microbacterium laevaniformans OR221]|nr:regulatory protein MarR [Microbacterium laevaniformans OR221]
MRMGGGPARLRLIEALHAASHPLSVSELGEAIGVDQPRAPRLVQQSVEMGLVQREADPDDARRTRIALTPVG